MSMLSVELWTCSALLLLVILGSCTVAIVALFLDHKKIHRYLLLS
jgi:hypothetical protein